MSGTDTSDPRSRPPDRRKLLAVVYADMVGYSRLIGLDDAGTLRRLRTLRRALIDPAIRDYGGRIVQTGGDSLLVAFDSIDGAVRCICVSRTVRDHIHGRINLPFEPLGLLKLKNITQPVEAFVLGLDPNAQ